MKPQDMIREITELQAARGNDTEILLVSPEEIVVAELTSVKQELVVLTFAVGGSKKKATKTQKPPPQNKRKRFERLDGE